MNQILGSQPDQPIPAPDPTYLDAGQHGAVVPFTVGQSEAAAVQSLAQAGYPPRTVPIASPAPSGQVIGQTPQGNLPTGTPVTLYTSTTRTLAQ
jgi:beta-lactam-binding protein with PASTA domain